MTRRGNPFRCQASPLRLLPIQSTYLDVLELRVSTLPNARYRFTCVTYGPVRRLRTSISMAVNLKLMLETSTHVLESLKVYIGSRPTFSEPVMMPEQRRGINIKSQWDNQIHRQFSDCQLTCCLSSH